MKAILQHFRMDAERPPIRLIRQAAEAMQQGAFAVVPTETTYALMMLPTAVEAQSSVRQLRRLDDKHLWSLVVSGLSQAAQYVRMDNQAHRILKRHLPGPYTFVLPANTRLPKRVFGKRRDVGIRMPQHAVCHQLLETLGEPLLATSMQFPEDAEAAMDPDDIAPRLRHMQAVLLDVGWGGMVPTTVVDLCVMPPVVIRRGQGVWNDV